MLFRSLSLRQAVFLFCQVPGGLDTVGSPAAGSEGIAVQLQLEAVCIYREGVGERRGLVSESSLGFGRINKSAN